MSEIKVSVGGKAEELENAAAARFIHAWHHGKREETGAHFHLAFESWEALTRVITTKRLEILRFVHRQPMPSIRALATALERDYSNVHADVQTLAQAGLLDLTDDGLRADYDSIDTRIAM